MRVLVQSLTRKLLSPQPIRTRVSSVMASNGKSDVDMKVNHCTDKHQFYIDLDPPNRAVLNYEMVTTDIVDLYHTGVPTDYRGHGIAAVLAKAAFGHFTASKTKMLLTCTYLQKYYKEHPDASRDELVSLPGSM